MKSFKKYLNENIQQQEYEKNRREMLDSIHSMSLEDAEAIGEMDLVTNPAIFIEGAFESKINPDHAFTRFLTHPKHSDESALKHVNYLLKIAHAKDNSGNYQPRENPNQVGAYYFIAPRFPHITMSIFREAHQKVDGRSRPPILEPMREKDPIVITPEHIESVKKHHNRLIYNPDRKALVNYYSGNPVFYPETHVQTIHDY